MNLIDKIKKELITKYPLVQWEIISSRYGENIYAITIWAKNSGIGLKANYTIYDAPDHIMETWKKTELNPAVKKIVADLKRLCKKKQLGEMAKQ